MNYQQSCYKDVFRNSLLTTIGEPFTTKKSYFRVHMEDIIFHADYKLLRLDKG